MRARFTRPALAAAAVSALAVTGLATAQAAFAGSNPTVAMVGCSTSALHNDISNAVDNETLRLAHNCTYVLTSALPELDADIIITGDGTATIERSYANATPDFRIFDIGDSTVVLNDLNLKNGNSSDSVGGAIYNPGGDLTINGGTISGNTADDDGGAFYNENIATVNNTTFTGNSATGEGDEGGAIYNEYELTVNTVTFTGNSADDAGGAIYLDDGAAVSNSTFNGNSANLGGAVYMTSDSDITLNRNTFYKDTATGDGGDGGALYNDSSADLSMTDNTFTDCSSAEDGGAFYNIGPTIINGGSFTYNYTPDYGGGIYNELTATLNGVSFYGNGAGEYGGGLYSEDDTTLNGGSFTGNTADAGGGLATGYETTMSHTSFHGNSASSDGGAIYNWPSSGTTSLSYGQVTDNWADSGGGIYNGTAGTFTLTSSTVAWNHPDNCAGTAVSGCTG